MTDNPQAANDEPLFNIPASVWRPKWRELRSDSGFDRIGAMYFWFGVCAGSNPDEQDYRDRVLISDIATTVAANRG